MTYSSTTQAVCSIQKTDASLDVAIEMTRKAMRDWKTKRAIELKEFANLKADLDKGLADLAAGKTKEFDPTRIIERGRKLLAGRAPSADGHRRG